jgi:hypothetical protein
VEVYRKPTATDVAINNASRPPKQHELAAYKNWIHRPLVLPLNESNSRKELNSIINTALNNA